MKKIISALIALTLLLSIAAIPVSAANLADELALFVNNGLTMSGSPRIYGNVVSGASVRMGDSGNCFIDGTLYLPSDATITTSGSTQAPARASYTEAPIYTALGNLIIPAASDFETQLDSLTVNWQNSVDGYYTISESMAVSGALAAANGYGIIFDTTPGKTIVILCDSFTSAKDLKIIGGGKVVIFTNELGNGSNSNINADGSAENLLFCFTGDELKVDYYNDIKAYIVAPNATSAYLKFGDFYGNVYTGGDVEICGNSNIHGFIYAPASDSHLAGSAKIYGSLVSNSLLMDGNTEIHNGDFTQGLPTAFYGTLVGNGGSGEGEPATHHCSCGAECSCNGTYCTCGDNCTCEDCGHGDTDEPSEPVTDEPSTEAPSEPVTDEPSEPVTDEPSEPVTDEPVTDEPTSHDHDGGDESHVCICGKDNCTCEGDCTCSIGCTCPACGGGNTGNCACGNSDCGCEGDCDCAPGCNCAGCHTAALDDDEWVTIPVITPKKMSVRLDDGTVLKSGSTFRMKVGSTIRFQMCSNNWDNDTYDDFGNGLAGTKVYEFTYTKVNHTLRTDTNTYFMAYRYHFNQDYDKQTGIVNVINTPLESLSVNLPLGSTITSDAYISYEKIDSDEVFIETAEDKTICYADYYWNH